jgi:hypothetical protein
MQKEHEELLEEIFGPITLSVLEMEIATIIRNYDISEETANQLARDIYYHLAENVIRSTDLLNYESYSETSRNKHQ